MTPGYLSHGMDLPSTCVYFRVGSGKTVACLKLDLDLAASGDVSNDKSRKVVVAVFDHDILDRLGGRFSRPDSLPRGSITLESRPRRRYPVVETLSGVGEVTVPAEWCRTVLIRVVGAEPM